MANYFNHPNPLLQTLENKTSKRLLQSISQLITFPDVVDVDLPLLHALVNEVVPNLYVFAAIVEDMVFHQGDRQLVVDEKLRQYSLLVQHLAK